MCLCPFASTKLLHVRAAIRLGNIAVGIKLSRIIYVSLYQPL